MFCQKKGPIFHGTFLKFATGELLGRADDRPAHNGGEDVCWKVAATKAAFDETGAVVDDDEPLSRWHLLTGAFSR